MVIVKDFIFGRFLLFESKIMLFIFLCLKMRLKLLLRIVDKERKLKLGFIFFCEILSMMILKYMGWFFLK